jgi:hypothetical protein
MESVDLIRLSADVVPIRVCTVVSHWVFVFLVLASILFCVPLLMFVFDV